MTSRKHDLSIGALAACFVAMIPFAAGCDKSSRSSPAGPAASASAPAAIEPPTGMFAGRAALDTLPAILAGFCEVVVKAPPPPASASASALPAASSSASARPRPSASAPAAPSASAACTAIGPRPRLYQIALFEESMSATLQLPTRPEYAYLVHAGKGWTPDPQLSRMDSPTMLQPDDYAFFLDAADLSLVPSMARDAINRCPSQPCRIGAMAVGQTGFDQSPVWRVWTTMSNGPSTTTIYDLAGRFVSTKSREDPAMPRAPRQTHGHEDPL